MAFRQDDDGRDLTGAHGREQETLDDFRDHSDTEQRRDVTSWQRPFIYHSAGLSRAERNFPFPSK